MGLPGRDAARNWVGRTVVDREGTALGPCTAVLADEATGLPEWMYVEVDGSGAVVPVVDATETAEQVRVTVSRAEVTGAPSVGDTGRLSEAQEEQLYRHYGIDFSRDTSESLLPAGEAGTPATGASSGTSGAASGARGRRPAAAIGVLAGVVAVAVTVRRARHARARQRVRLPWTERLWARRPWAPRPPTPAERVAQRLRAAAATAAARVGARTAG
ncbi:hypothetical protein [Geodermatophilus sabuli]|uniref:PRC-barrel domain-containing protein n=1 Tax=Geodermatophilus sabuli TaxID=1564158 RepID=A0A285EDF2_9ACTN|nr:hypothetical protein [Geodermatophilus sabuli]MBB3083247.1 hypothetical protein [Geodermatophilus sabuli]SNX97030.1 hypothetical protein SAMN06893097_105373 [Geodermatophilus sabuli]